MRCEKQQVVTFKADEALINAIKGVENRSEFIRTAILAALENACPLCKGAGIMTPQQKKHWESFKSSHSVEECGLCHAMHIVCSHSGQEDSHTSEKRKKKV